MNTQISNENKKVCAVSILCKNYQGVMRDVSDTLVKYNANILLVQASVIAHGDDKGNSNIYIEFEPIEDLNLLSEELTSLDSVISVSIYRPLLQFFGKRVIIIGGGAQVAQVALGAVNEADRHNIRGERISVDTIPIVGEDNLSAIIDAVCRLPRVSILVLAGSLMGGEISNSVERVKAMGIPVISLNMAGSVRKHADLVVTDPIQAGVFAVMHVSSMALFDINRVRGQTF